MNKKAQCPLGTCGGICPFCTGQIGSVAKSLWISGSTFATAIVGGLAFRFKHVWIPKIKMLFNFNILP